MTENEIVPNFGGNERAIMVKFKEKKYVILIIYTEEDKKPQLFPTIIDYDDYLKIDGILWCRVNRYVGRVCSEKSMYMHQYVLDYEFDGKLYVDHINRICHDNRKENLRLVTQSQQNLNQRKRKRTTILPDDCGFLPDDIPSNVDYHRESDKMGAYFEVTFKIGGKRVFRKKTTKSRGVSLAQKLQESKDIINNLVIEQPEWFLNRCMNGNYTDEGNKLYESYFEILKLAKIEDPSNTYLTHEERNKKLL